MFYFLQFPFQLGYSVSGKYFMHTKSFDGHWHLQPLRPTFSCLWKLCVCKPDFLMPFGFSQVSRNNPFLPCLFYYILIIVFFLGGEAVSEIFPNFCCPGSTASHADTLNLGRFQVCHLELLFKRQRIIMTSNSASRKQSEQWGQKKRWRRHKEALGRATPFSQNNIIPDLAQPVKIKLMY